MSDPRPAPLPVRDPSVYMHNAYRMARAAAAAGEVPVGAVIVHGGAIIARAHNQIEALHDPTAHAEMIAITQAAEHLQSKILTGAAIYVTLEPCPMCAMALVLAKVDLVIFATPDPRTGAGGSVFNILQDPRLNHRVEIESGLMQAECGDLLKEFFRARR
jgi:tRNA(adenine34) deaminase